VGTVFPQVKKLDVLSDEIFVNVLKVRRYPSRGAQLWNADGKSSQESHCCAVLVSEERDDPIIVEPSKAGVVRSLRAALAHMLKGSYGNREVLCGL
jgi:hypothetical protein